MVRVVMITIGLFFVPLLHSALAGEAITFRDVSQEAGVEMTSPTWGVSWGDVNADGWEDIYISNHQYNQNSEGYGGVQSPPSLFVNQGDGTFLDMRDVYGLKYHHDKHGAAWGDMDNDGYPELFQSQGSNQGKSGLSKFLYYNNGGQTFVDIAASAGVDRPVSRGRGGCWFDYDNDGLLDLYTSNVFVPGYPSTLFRNRGDMTFEDVGALTGLEVTASRGCTPLDFDNDGLLDLFLAANPFHLFKNKGDGTYEDVTSISFPSEAAKSFGYAWGDYDNDGDMDVYMAASALRDAFKSTSQSITFSTTLQYGNVKGYSFQVVGGSTITFDIYNYEWRLLPKKIYIGQNRVNPAENPLTLAVDDPTAAGDPGMLPGEDTAAFIWRDGDWWYIQGTTLLDDMNETFSGIITTDGQISNISVFSSPPMVSVTGIIPSRLYKNQGDGTFLDVAAAAGVSDGSNAQAAVFVDVNNDGFLDLYVVYTRELNNEPNRLYMNQGDGTFVNVAAAAGAEANVAGRGESVAVADYDNNGFMDLLVANGLGPAPFSYGRHTLLKNNGNGSHWLQVRLKGTASNRDAVGAKVRVSAAGKAWFRQQTGGASRYTQDSRVIHFGLGGATAIDSLEVTWPSGVTQTLNNIAVDQLIDLQEPSVEISLVPLSTSVTQGGSIKYTLTLTNRSKQRLTVDLWMNITFSMGTRPGKSWGPKTVSIPPGATLSRTMSHPIPASAPEGVYTLNGLVGVHRHSWIWASDIFDFTVTAP